MARYPLKERNVKMNFVRRCQMLSKAWQEQAKAPLQKSKKMWQLWDSGYHVPGYSREHTINLLDRGMGAIIPFLVDGDPRIMVETQIPSHRPWAKTTELAMNYFVEKLNFAEDVLIPLVRNSLVSAGVTRTNLVHTATVEGDVGKYMLSRPEVEVIDYANYIGDPAATCRRNFAFEGHQYIMPTEYAREFFGKSWIVPDNSLINKLSPRDIARPEFDRNVLALRSYTTFIDLYLYEENVIITILPEGGKAKIVRTVEWDGPEGGPYDVLAYKYMADDPIPIPPAWSWHDMDVTMNLLVDKMKQQAETQKDILAYEDRAEEDVQRIIETPGTGTVRVNNLNAIKPISFNGVNPLNFSWVDYVENQFTKQGAAPDVLGGRGTSADTLGQEQMVFANATRLVGTMYSRFASVAESILKKLAWAFWTNPTTYVPVLKEIPGVGQLPVVFSGQKQVGDFYDFAFKIAPYSTQRDIPDVKFQKLMQFMVQWILPTMQLAAQQGTSLDITTVSQVLASYMGINSIDQWYKSAVPQSQLDLVNYTMLPGNGQGNDSFGANMGSRNANLAQQQARAGGQSSPNQQTGMPQ